MGEVMNVHRTKEDVRLKAEKLLQSDYRWNNPKYTWDIESTKHLSRMGVDELDLHLKMMIGAKLSIDELRMKYQDQLNQLDNENKSSIKNNNIKFSKFKNLSMHPNELSYRQKHGGGMPKARPLNINVRFLWIVFIIIAIIIWAKLKGWEIMNTGSIPLNTMLIYLRQDGIKFFGWMVWIGILLFILSWFVGVIADPIGTYKNKKRENKYSKIIKSDTDYCESNNINDDTLKTKFKFNESIDIINRMYIDNINIAIESTEYELNHYYETLSNHIYYFPIEDTKNMAHMLRIYEQILKGSESYHEADTFVSHSEQLNRMERNLTDEIRNANISITNSIRDSQVSLSGSIQKYNDNVSNNIISINKNVNGLNNKIAQQTNRLKDLDERQSKNNIYQTNKINEINASIKSIN
ncbi:hypothetical protein [Companilactobacillus sp.]|uniref:hypothetical protein n=1 Tax=Companilactobacillus sp. TaxID=2767905 RepID=UPI0025C50282|nr:hypothetical protein [Companilactobacillus sp.]MCH4009531.1 hypothetical protein [Companilactobacillus sp.]MCH4052793.1 hypothetical protein [Companilactobacillus sp.]MCH4077473.1 hypothetical protein [Companilactobacillus sp.]MCH4126049.1 hypothetical protein [Companilactobacillus sp.]MCI1311757.1 hypothetical protein [Companilactobacillus sp.]